MTSQSTDIRKKAAARLLELIGHYWNLAYAEGKRDATHDTKNGDAQRTWSEIERLVASLAEDAHLVPSDAEDAARYRWLRRGLADSQFMADVVAQKFADALDQKDAKKFDAAIDAARKEGKP